MTAELLSRIRKELTLNLAVLQEAVVAISERVNRKVQLLKLHWQASYISHRIHASHRSFGAQLFPLVSSGGDLKRHENALDRQEAAGLLSAATSQVRLLKKELAQVDALIRELEVEAMREDLLNIQQDLSTRSATIERVHVAQGSWAMGRSISQLGLAPTTRVAAVLRGPALLPLTDTLVFRSGDLVVVVGPGVEVRQLLPCFAEQQSIRTA
jgi:K+/H+ antiporter YhaU regulatory subunit KhtT